MDNHQLVWVVLKYQFNETRPVISDEEEEEITITNMNRMNKNKGTWVCKPKCLYLCVKEIKLCYFLVEKLY